MSTRIETELRKFDHEVQNRLLQNRTPEIANDVMGVHQTDVWVILKDHHEWREGMTRDRLIEEMSAALSENVPGVVFGFTQPIEMRVDELVGWRQGGCRRPVVRR